MESKSVNTRILPAFLIAICLVPFGFGSYRLASLIIQWDWILNWAVDQVDALPLAVHVLSAVSFLLLGALQMLPKFRHAKPARHRKIGKLTIVAGCIGAGSGIVMTVIHTDISGQLLYIFRLIFGVYWIVCLVLALRAIRQRAFIQHRAWMIRAYAIAVNAGTLPFIFLPLYLIFGELDPLVGEAIQVLGWFVNLSVAQWIIRRIASQPTRLPTQPLVRPPQTSL